MGIKEDLENIHPDMRKGRVWCRKCGREKEVDTMECLRGNWPECCGSVMTLEQSG